MFRGSHHLQQSQNNRVKIPSPSLLPLPPVRPIPYRPPPSSPRGPRQGGGEGSRQDHTTRHTLSLLLIPSKLSIQNTPNIAPLPLPTLHFPFTRPQSPRGAPRRGLLDRRMNGRGASAQWVALRLLGLLLQWGGLNWVWGGWMQWVRGWWRRRDERKERNGIKSAHRRHGHSSHVTNLVGLLLGIAEPRPVLAGLLCVAGKGGRGRWCRWGGCVGE